MWQAEHSDGMKNASAAAVRAGRRGFTLIELLVVVAIIGILAAVAVPQFIAYRYRAYDARANSDIRNAATGEEAYFTSTGEYVTCSNTDCADVLPDFRLSPDVEISMTADNGLQPSFTGEAHSPKGSHTFVYDSAAGGITN